MSNVEQLINIKKKIPFTVVLNSTLFKMWHSCIFSCLLDGSLVENETKFDGNPIIFLANAMEMPWRELVQNPCHVPVWTQVNMTDPVKNVTEIFSCLFYGSLVEDETESDGNPIIFLANAEEIPWLELFQNPCHVFSMENK